MRKTIILSRRNLLAATGGIAALAAHRVAAQGPATGSTIQGVRTMEIRRSGSQPSGRGTSGYFTVAVRVDLLFRATDPARVAGASVTFEPGAHTAWHTHPLGQTLIVTSGFGWVQ
jgi:hypothetical protein